MRSRDEKMCIMEYFDSVADERKHWRKKAWYLHKAIQKNMRLLIPEQSSVLEIGCEAGDLLASLNPRRGVGVDFSEKTIEIAKNNHSNLEFRFGDINNLEKLGITEQFDYIILGSPIGYLDDIQHSLEQLKTFCRADTRVCIIYYNYFWAMALKLAESLKLRMKRPNQHWFSGRDVENFLNISGLELIKIKHCLLIPFNVLFLSNLINRFLSDFWFFKKFSLIHISIARIPMTHKKASDATCSVVIPCRNEKGNIEQAVLRIPPMGKNTEIIFVEGHSKDGTLAECERVRDKYKDRKIKVLVQKGSGKGDAVREGFAEAGGDILMILDADLTVYPEDLTKFFNAIVSGRGEFINGSRLVYKMEKEAMHSLNLLGNKFFSYMFTFLLGQYLKDTLCGTKVLWRGDYKKIVSGRSYFGDFDPFGDFDLLFGAAKLNLKIVEVPVHYHERMYGSTQIRRFRHGWLLLKMTIFAMRKIKFV